MEEALSTHTMNEPNPMRLQALFLQIKNDQSYFSNGRVYYVVDQDKNEVSFVSYYNLPKDVKQHAGHILGILLTETSSDMFDSTYQNELDLHEEWDCYLYKEGVVYIQTSSESDFYYNVNSDKDLETNIKYVENWIGKNVRVFQNSKRSAHETLEATSHFQTKTAFLMKNILRQNLVSKKEPEIITLLNETFNIEFTF